MERFSARFPGTPSSLAPMRATLRAWLESIAVGEEESWDVVLAVNEAAANAIDHGRPEAYEVALAVVDGGLEATVRDEGSWQAARDDDIERGRGIAIMRALAEAVDVSGSTAGTTVRLRFRVGPPAPVCA